MKAFVIVIAFTLCFWQLSAQFNNNFWCFGDSTGINWSNANNPTFFTNSIKGRGSCVTLADSTGLKLYAQTSDSNTIYNMTGLFNIFNLEVPGSDSIVGEAWYHELLLIPHPGNDSLAFLFSIGVTTIAKDYGLFYTLINYKANNDSGLIVAKNVQLSNLPAFDGITAVKHGNGRDWWLIFRYYDPVNFIYNNITYTYLITENGIGIPLIQNVGTLSRSGAGQVCFNEQGYIVVVTWAGFIEQYDFDRCTGLLSNPVQIEPPRLTGPYPYYSSCAFSPDGSKLYVTSWSQYSSTTSVDTLYQFDLNATDIAASKTVIHANNSWLEGMGCLKIAPDNKIYLSSTDRNFSIPYQDTSYSQVNTHLSVINYPDSLGAACDFQPFSFYLGGTRTYVALPNNPDYELGPLIGSPCDTLTNIAEIKNEINFHSWFHADWEILFVNADKLKGNGCTVNVYDLSGRLIKTQKGKPYSGYFTADVALPGLSSGVYIVQLVTEKESVSGKLFKN